MLLTAFGSDSTNWNPFEGQQSDLPLFVWKLIRVPERDTECSARGPARSCSCSWCSSCSSRLATSRAEARRSSGGPVEHSHRVDSSAPRERRRTGNGERVERSDSPETTSLGSHHGPATLETKALERVVREAQGARAVQPAHGVAPGDRADRAVGLRQVDVPADPQPDARGDPRRGDLGQGRARRHRRLRQRAERDPGAHAHRHGLPEAEPVPFDVDQAERARRAEAVAHAGR